VKKIRIKHPRLDVNKYHSGPGHVPGVYVNKCFSFRAELCLVGLHRQPQAGIDWKQISNSKGYLIPTAISIVVSGKYEDDSDKLETLIYTGEGGRDANTGRQIEDQKCAGGNLALVNSYLRRNSVRVIIRRKERMRTA
jgi:euchromatic histone-lysine N-methyltransferase